MRLLITGGAGFIGSNFIRYWNNKYPKDKIFNLDKLTYAANRKNLENLSNPQNHKLIVGDICNKDLVDKLVDDVDTIVHFATESHVDNSIKSPEEFLQTNVLGTFTMLNAATKHKKRIHHVSTDEVFGSLKLKSQEKFSEKTPYDPRSPYSASKASSDHLARAFHHTFGTEVTISNCSNNYGPYQHIEKFIPLFVTNLMQDKKVPLYGDGLNVRDWIHVDDHCLAIETILLKGKIGESYCIGGGAEKSNKEITYKILDLMGKDKSYIEFVEDRKGHDRRYALDFSKIKNELGFRPKMDFDKGLKQTVYWYKGNEDWWMHQS